MIEPAPFKTIKEHWNPFLERDIHRDAPPVQVMEMKRAFLAGAISGLHLSVSNPEEIQTHLDDIKNMVKK